MASRRVDSAVKSTLTENLKQHPHRGSQPSVIPTPGHLLSSSDLHRHPHGVRAYTQAKHSHTLNNSKKREKLKKKLSKIEVKER